MKKKVNAYQELTSKILREATFSEGSGYDYSNPIRQNLMMTRFYMNLKYKKKYSTLRKIFALLFFIIPGLVGLSAIYKYYPKGSSLLINVFSISLMGVLALYTAAGIKLFKAK